MPSPWSPDTDVLGVTTLSPVYLILVLIDKTQHHPCYLVILPRHPQQAWVEIRAIDERLEILPWIGDVSPVVAKRFIGSLPDQAHMLWFHRAYLHTRWQGQLRDILQIGTNHLIRISRRFIAMMFNQVYPV